MSSSRCSVFKSFSNTTIAKAEVPAEMFPVLTAKLLVATIPVPASPSGGQASAPALSSPDGSINFAPSSVKFPACSPATKVFGRISFKLHG